MKKTALRILPCIVASIALAACASTGNSVKAELSADDAIESVTTLGFVDVDGSKTYAIAVKYTVDLAGAEIGLDSFEVADYGTTLTEKNLDMGKNPGMPLKAYINTVPEVSSKGGTVKGSYVIIEVNTEYQVNRFARSWKVTMAAGVKQVKPITTKRNVILPGTKAKTNYEVITYIGFNPMTGQARDPEYYNYALDGTYTIKGIEKYELHKIEDGTAFHAVNCYDEANGKYWNFDLPYALYVPEDYNPTKKYALVLHIHDAGSMSTDPMLTLTEAQGPNNYASEAFQNLAKEQGLGGAIVVCPAIDEFFAMDAENPKYDLRMARDNYTLSCGAPAIWQLMDSMTEKYSIDTNRIYGSGQSMGGMTVMAMAAQRDNYFAGILPLSCVWGSNFNKEQKLAGKTYFNAPADGEIIWNVDSDGNACDYNNWFYLISDDNMLYMNTVTAPEYQILYEDLVGVKAESAILELGPDTTAEARNVVVRELVSRESELGMYFVSLTGNVGHMSAWFYGHGTFAAYEWLLRQTRESEMKRAKLDLDKPFMWANTQIQTDARIYSTAKDGTKTYYPTGMLGAGTVGYNSGCSALGSSDKLAPGWVPAK